ncbi:DUF6151 family protein [Gilvimarinus sp. F26214L]|uniref:DUF6151 family protein n=1 Tax=Gilvimarinus sp. DZF01 TaxID=3461371 RepID=UPI00404656DE
MKHGTQPRDVGLQCACGTVKGVARKVSPQAGNRVVCYCSDCQAFARFLEKEAEVLDAWGGTDIFQMSQGRIVITAGEDALACMRLSPNGIIRWYARCCHTPLVNTSVAGMPIVGVVHTFIANLQEHDRILGPVRDYVQGRDARSKPPHPVSDGFPLASFPRLLFMTLKAKLRGEEKPSPFFDSDGRPKREPLVLNSEPPGSAA